MLRLCFFGVAFALVVTAGTRARAEAGETGTSAVAPAASDDSQSASASDEDAAPTPRQHRHKRSRKHPIVSGHVVPEDKLRDAPLPHPSGNLHLVFPGVKDEVEVNIYNADGSYNLDALEEATHVLRCRPTDTEKPIDPQLLMLLSHVYDHFGSKPLEIVSGYRNQR